MKFTKISRRAMLGAMAGIVTAAAFASTTLAADKITVGALRFTSHSASFVAFERGYFKANGFHGHPDFTELARRFDLPVKRSKMILNLFSVQQDAVRDLIARSFLSRAAKEDYSKRFTDRLRTMRS